jgi:hypothetical protein
MCSGQTEGDPPDLQDRYVQFHIRDVYVPEPAKILEELHGLDLLSGRVIGLSDSGVEMGAFAVVEVSGLSQSVVVPVAKIIDSTMG